MSPESRSCATSAAAEKAGRGELVLYNLCLPNLPYLEHASMNMVLEAVSRSWNPEQYLCPPLRARLWCRLVGKRGLLIQRPVLIASDQLKKWRWLDYYPISRYIVSCMAASWTCHVNFPCPCRNAILLCDGPGCEVALHQHCCGVAEIPEGDWLCDGCAAGAPPQAHMCLLCPVSGGALRRVGGTGPVKLPSGVRPLFPEGYASRWRVQGQLPHAWGPRHADPLHSVQDLLSVVVQRVRSWSYVCDQCCRL